MAKRAANEKSFLHEVETNICFNLLGYPALRVGLKRNGSMQVQGRSDNKSYLVELLTLVVQFRRRENTIRGIFKKMDNNNDKN